MALILLYSLSLKQRAASAQNVGTTDPRSEGEFLKQQATGLNKETALSSASGRRCHSNDPPGERRDDSCAVLINSTCPSSSAALPLPRSRIRFKAVTRSLMELLALLGDSGSGRSGDERR
jgi:hypothetical protein